MALLDPRLFDRVVANLVNNAIKFSPRRAAYRWRPPFRRLVVVRVQDQGPGIPEDQRPKLFQRFNEMGSQRADSSGLGLFIVQALVAAQGGTVAAEFPPEGGAVFEVAFAAGGRLGRCILISRIEPESSAGIVDKGRP